MSHYNWLGIWLIASYLAYKVAPVGAIGGTWILRNAIGLRAMQRLPKPKGTQRPGVGTGSQLSKGRGHGVTRPTPPSQYFKCGPQSTVETAPNSRGPSGAGKCQNGGMAPDRQRPAKAQSASLFRAKQRHRAATPWVLAHAPPPTNVLQFGFRVQTHPPTPTHPPYIPTSRLSASASPLEDKRPEPSPETPLPSVGGGP